MLTTQARTFALSTLTAVLLIAPQGFPATVLSADSTPIPLEEELSHIRAQIESAEVDDARYSGGLIKSLIGIRLEVLRITEALIAQRLHAEASGASVDLLVPATAPDPERAAELYAEVLSAQRNVESARANADRYSGGLVAAMAASTVATSENTLAMLQQEYLAAKYGFSIPTVGAHSSTGPRGTDHQESTSMETPSLDDSPAESAGDFQIVGVDAKVTERNDSWSKFAWQLTLKNNSAATIRVDATIEFLDSDGFVVEDDREYGLVLPGGQQETYRGYDLVDAEIAHNVSSVNAKVARDR